MKTILIQGANELEVMPYINHFRNLDVKTIDNYVFYDGEYGDYEIIISITGVGTINAAASTVVGIYNFKPALVITQGTAGAHVNDLKIGDIIIGEDSVYINKFETPPKGKGKGSNALEWIPMKKGSNKVPASKELIDVARSLKCSKNLKFGTLGTGDMFSREIDRINYIHSIHGELSEDMETVAVYKVCENAGVPFIGFRVISNNEITDPCQEKEQRKENMKNVIPKLADTVLEFIEKVLED